MDATSVFDFNTHTLTLLADACERRADDANSPVEVRQAYQQRSVYLRAAAQVEIVRKEESCLSY